MFSIYKCVLFILNNGVKASVSFTICNHTFFLFCFVFCLFVCLFFVFVFLFFGCLFVLFQECCSGSQRDIVNNV